MSRTERKGTPTPVADLPGLIGQEVGVSRWITVDQARIDAFAEITEDRQFIHIDPALFSAIIADRFDPETWGKTA